MNEQSKEWSYLTTKVQTYNFEIFQNFKKYN